METYAQARARLLAELAAFGWKTSKPTLKVTWAEVPEVVNGTQFRVWFRSQAVYLNEHSLFLDIRGMAVHTFINDVRQSIKRRGDF